MNNIKCYKGCRKEIKVNFPSNFVNLDENLMIPKINIILNKDKIKK